MSCIYCDPAAFAYVLKAATSPEMQFGCGSPRVLRWWHGGEWRALEAGNPDEMCRVAQILHDANLASFRSVYPREKVEGYRLTPADLSRKWDRYDPVQVIKTCQYIAYQSDDPEEWRDSEARAILEAIKEKATMKLPGYNEAEWGEPND